MRNYKKVGLMLCISLAVCSFGGCSTAGAGDASLTAAGMENTPVIDYTLPRTLPNIFVDLEGYQAHSQKEAAVKGRSLPEEFALIDVQTGEEVYSGKIQKIVFHEKSQLFTGCLDFGEFVKEGSYYLECDMIGRSKTFEIRKDLYMELYNEVSEEMMEACREGSAEAERVMSFLLACEWYPDILKDRDANGTPDEMESISQWIQIRERETADTYEGALYAALLAKFSYLYQDYNRQYATQCLQKASAVFETTRNTIENDAEKFLALTELYRATGMNTYGSRIRDYRRFFEDNSSYLDKQGYLYGVMTYLATRQQVDRELCGIFMDNLMESAREIFERYPDLLHPVEPKNNGAEDLLKQAGELSCANYVLNNYQYTEAIENILHYLMGQNMEAVSFYREKEESWRYLFLFAQLAATAKYR